MRKWRKVTELTQQISRKDVLQLQCGSGIFMAVPVARHTHTHTHRRAGTLTQRKELTHTFYFWAHTHTADTACLQYGRHLMRTTGTHTPMHHRCAACTDIFSYFALKCALEVFGKAILKSPHTRATLTTFFCRWTFFSADATSRFCHAHIQDEAKNAKYRRSRNIHQYEQSLTHIRTQLTHTQDIPQTPLI